VHSGSHARESFETLLYGKGGPEHEPGQVSIRPNSAQSAVAKVISSG
jgi:hypothetical protein